MLRARQKLGKYRILALSLVAEVVALAGATETAQADVDLAYARMSLADAYHVDGRFDEALSLSELAAGGSPVRCPRKKGTGP